MKSLGRIALLFLLVSGGCYAQDGMGSATQTQAVSDVGEKNVDMGFLIDHVQIQGLPEGRQWLEDRAQKIFCGRLNVQNLKKGLRQLNKDLNDAGFIASSIQVPNQNLSQGELRLVYKKGVIGGYQAPGMNLDRYFDLSVGDELDLRQLEQGLDQFNRIPSRFARLYLLPGKDPFHTVVAVERFESDKKWQGAVTYGRGIPSKAGDGFVNWRLSFDEPLKCGDRLGLSFTHDDRFLGKEFQRRFDFEWSLPWKRHFVRLNAGVSTSRQLIQGHKVEYNVESVNRWAEISDQIMVYRDQRRKVFTDFSLRLWAEDSWLNQIPLVFRRRRQTFVSAGLSGVMLIDKGVASWRLGLRASVPFLGAEVLRSDEGSTQFWVLEGDVSYMTQLGNSCWSLNLFARGQWTTDVLFVNDRFLLGGEGSVRGFRSPWQFDGEQGIAVQTELTAKVSPTQDWYAAVDMGSVRRSNGGKWCSLVGGVVGWRWNSQRLKADVSLAVPLIYPKNWTPDKWIVSARVGVEF